ncbi:ArnT family glycosyltransferase [Novosphingobium terrae]|uniref:ArnT family glycosyltransferase n=1 Tax=Novosphingobium terrae TaxID=2726189 RepID=UPI001980F9BA|nr:glycosyltransferase family 39 protein [Novosphingobium terrae]
MPAFKPSLTGDSAALPPEVRKQALWVAAITLGLHLLILAYDRATDFRAFSWGDRGLERTRILKIFADLHDPLLPAMTQSPIVPGEYIFALIPWTLAGPVGVIVMQIALAVLAAWLVARLAGRVTPWPRAPLACGLIYACIPQNLAFPHQLVTEAIVTPLCMVWLYATLSGLRGGRIAPFLIGGLALGLAMLTRPVVLLMLPVTFVLALLSPPARARLKRPGLYAMAAMALVPFAIWVAIFTSVTGHIGYNTGSANLAWNLRSKILITEKANGITPPEDVVTQEAGTSPARFLTEVRLHPVPFIKAAVLDTVTVFVRGNTTKITVDYLGIGRDPAGWRQQLVYAHDARQAWLAQVLSPVFLLEEAGSLLTGLFFAFVLWRVLVLLREAMRAAPAAPSDPIFLTLVTAAWLINVLLSAQMVDQAQGRLRNPAEAALILFAAMALGRMRQRLKGL